jgi:hypothetical protein
MHIQQTIEIDGTEAISAYFIPEAQKQGITLTPDDVKISVWSETKQQYIPFKPDKVKFTWHNK